MIPIYVLINLVEVNITLLFGSGHHLVSSRFEGWRRVVKNLHLLYIKCGVVTTLRPLTSVLYNLFQVIHPVTILNSHCIEDTCQAFLLNVLPTVVNNSLITVQLKEQVLQYDSYIQTKIHIFKHSYI